MKFVNPELYIKGQDHSRNWNRENNDCVVKAFAILYQISYDEAHGFTRGFFNRHEKDGVYNMTSMMSQLISNKNLQFNGDVSKVRIRGTILAKDLSNLLPEGCYLILTQTHAAVFIDGKWIDYKGIVKKNNQICAIYEFNNFSELEEIRSKLQDNSSSDFDYWLIVIIIAGILLFVYNSEVKREIKSLKRWVKKEINF
jgi:hypothetical protein